MGLKRHIYLDAGKHRWHLSYRKLKRLNYLFNLIDHERGSLNPVAGRYALHELHETKRKGGKSECRNSLKNSTCPREAP